MRLVYIGFRIAFLVLGIAAGFMALAVIIKEGGQIYDGTLEHGGTITAYLYIAAAIGCLVLAYSTRRLQERWERHAELQEWDAPPPGKGR